MILQEALAITLVSGYLGLVAAVALVTAAEADAAARRLTSASPTWT